MSVPSLEPTDPDILANASEPAESRDAGRSVANSAEEWEDLTLRAFEVPLLVDKAVPDFRARIDQARLSTDVSVTRVRAAGCRLLRTSRLTSTEPRDDMFLALHLDGSGVIGQNDTRSEVTIGEGVFYSARDPYELDYSGFADKLIVQISPDAQRRLALDRIPLAVPVLKPSPLADVLVSMLKEATTLGVQIGEQKHALGEITESLLHGLVRSSQEGYDVAPAGRPALLLTLQRTVDQHLADPDLTPVFLARRHGLSLRYVHSLFTDLGQPPASYIRAQRLAAAHRLLVGASTAHLPIAVVAGRCGFLDVSTFTRAFRREFDMSPSEVRLVGELTHPPGESEPQPPD